MAFRVIVIQDCTIHIAEKNSPVFRLMVEERLFYPPLRSAGSMEKSGTNR